MEQDESVKLHRADPGRRRMVWLDVSDPDGAFDSIMTLVHESGAADQEKPNHETTTQVSVEATCDGRQSV
jgi:hypothetical protein